jgi:hypothetical protein
LIQSLKWVKNQHCSSNNSPTAPNISPILVCALSVIQKWSASL